MSESETLQLTRRLVALDTIDPPGNEHRAAAVVAEILSKEGIDSHIEEIAPGRTNLVARIKGTGETAGLAFSAHFDTIGVEHEKWSVDPFGSQCKDSRLYGRGTTDMKGGMSAMVIAALRIKRAGIPLKGDLVLTFSAAENSNCLGAHRLVKDGAFEGVGALLISEPSGNKPFVSQKGALWLRVTAQGEYGHNAFSEDRQGDRGNAIVRLARYLDKAHDLVLEAPAHRHLKPATINIGTIRGGLSTPLVPSEASADIDVRLVPGLEPEAVLNAFRNIAGPQVSVELLDVKPPVDTPDDHPFATLCVDACCQHTGIQHQAGGVAYYSDGSVIAPVLDIPMVIIGPGEVGMSGAVDEYVDLQKLEQSVDIFETIAKRWLS